MKSRANQMSVQAAPLLRDLMEALGADVGIAPEHLPVRMPATCSIAKPASRRADWLMRIVFPYSHAFRGGSVVVDDDGKGGPGCLVEFGDGVTVIGEWRPADEGIHLHVPAYRTAKGSKVAARNWVLARHEDGGWRSKLADVAE